MPTAMKFTYVLGMVVIVGTAAIGSARPQRTVPPPTRQTRTPGQVSTTLSDMPPMVGSRRATAPARHSTPIPESARGLTPRETFFAIVTVIIALYGAALSTYTASVQRRDKKRRVDVTLSYGLVGISGVPGVLMEGKNSGERPVHISFGGISLPNGMVIALPASRFVQGMPHDLLDGKSLTAFASAEELAGHLREQGYTGDVVIVGVLRSALGVEYKSDPFTVNVELLQRRADDSSV